MNLAVGGHELEAEHAVAGDTFFQALRAARVLGDVATDGALFARGWVWRVVQPVLFGRRAD